MAAGQVLLERLASAVVPSVLPIVSAAVAAAVPHAAPRGASAGAAPPHAGSAGRRHAPAPAAAPHAPAAGYYSRELAENVCGEKVFDTDAIRLSDSQRFLAQQAPPRDHRSGRRQRRSAPPSCGSGTLSSRPAGRCFALSFAGAGRRLPRAPQVFVRDTRPLRAACIPRLPVRYNNFARGCGAAAAAPDALHVV
eukprot:TRINITY_DN4587_c0_g1_i6.p2 TRINITY_DN4587_c0_g1~~TRINITY_DN4587_c0_g1_i6.p2  ORF type:complete len:194 (+),score=5.08 TRINITY_DN4587_c0_g1_i6:81-662(+)